LKVHGRPSGEAQEQGLGLGLAIVERIARMLGHVIELRSAEGWGSVFAVAVPRGVAAETKEPPRPVPALSDGGLAGAVILCIDDNADIRDGMRALLGGWNCDVRWMGMRRISSLPTIISARANTDRMWSPKSAASMSG